MEFEIIQIRSQMGRITKVELRGSPIYGEAPVLPPRSRCEDVEHPEEEEGEEGEEGEGERDGDETDI
jgi:hypothetical protein